MSTPTPAENGKKPVHPPPHDPARAVHPLVAAEHRRGHGARERMQVRRQHKSPASLVGRIIQNKQPVLSGSPRGGSANQTKLLFCMVRAPPSRAVSRACLFWLRSLRGAPRGWALVLPACALGPVRSRLRPRPARFAVLSAGVRPSPRRPLLFCLPLPWASAGKRVYRLRDPVADLFRGARRDSGRGASLDRPPEFDFDVTPRPSPRLYSRRFWTFPPAPFMPWGGGAMRNGFG
jgi:hypothetical protein